MNSSLYMLFTILISFHILYPDCYVREKLHTDSYYHSGVVHPAEDSEREVWIGEKKLCTLRQNWKIVLDLNKNMMFIINLMDSSYVECGLPFQWSKVVSEEFVGMLKVFETKGTVQKTEKKKKIGTWDCQEFVVNSYMIYEGSKFNETDSKIWASPEMLSDEETFSRMIGIMRKFANYDSSFIEQLSDIEGYQISLESLFYPKGFSVTSSQKVVEVIESDPPSGIYEVPAAFSKKENLTLDELRSL
ncbi:MAG: hypothetical protein JSW33_16530 [bacterium]|nr:MAG: hypothetical protein JSW33_16530 [bacterium]